MKFILVGFAVFAGWNAHAQQAKHLPGRHLSIAIPEGFKERERGSWHRGSTIIYIHESDGLSLAQMFPYKKVKDVFVPAIKVEALRDTMVKGYPGYWLHTLGERSYRFSSPDQKETVELIFGDSLNTVWVAVVSHQQTIPDDVLQMFSTIDYYPKKRIDPLEGASFSLDTNYHGYAFLTAPSEMYMFTEGGKVVEGPAEPTIMITPVQHKVESPSNVTVALTNGILFLGVNNAKTLNVITRQIGNVNRYETIVRGTLRDQDIYLAQYLLEYKGEAILIQGFGSIAVPALIEKIRTFADAIHFPLTQK